LEAALLKVTVLALLAGVGGRSPALTLPLAALGLAAFLAVERRAGEPMIPLTLFRDPVIATASVAGALMGSVMMASLTYLPLHVQAVLRGTPTAAGTAVAPMLIGWPVASAVAGRLLARTSYRVLVRTGLVAVGVATFALWRLLAAGAGTSSMRAVMLLFGAGMGFANTALIVMVQERAGFAMRGVATASTMFFRTIGGAVAVGALGALLKGFARGLVCCELFLLGEESVLGIRELLQQEPLLLRTHLELRARDRQLLRRALGHLRDPGDLGLLLS
jgi:hypothetical protein